MSSPRAYTYQELNRGDIRVLDIQPGNREDDIRLDIVHIHLEANTSREDPRLSRSALQATLPSGWEVSETPEGRYLFSYDPDDDSSNADEDAEFHTTWIHPDSQFDHSLYQLPPDETIWAREPCFEALSYVWGSRDNPKTATVGNNDGVEPLATIALGQNLASAIVHLRYLDRIRRLWADAVCIHQDDEAEKAIQISRMNEIYSSAARVIVWLGAAEDDEDTQEIPLAMSTLKYIGEQVETTIDGFRITSPDAKEKDWYDIDMALPFDRRTWHAMVGLCRNPWFKRVWTAQEIMLANRLAIIQHGSSTLSWSHFRRAVFCILDKQEVPFGGRAAFGSARSAAIDVTHRPLSEVFARHLHRECFDPRDKVYGMLGIAPPAFRRDIVVDLKKPLEEVYRDAFLINAKNTRRWEPFGYGARHEDLQTAPSWVPDLLSKDYDTYQAYQLTAGISELNLTYEAPNRIHVTGLKFAAIQESSDHVLPAPNIFLKTIRSWIPANIDDTEGSDGISRKDEYLITLAQGTLLERFPDDEGWPTMEKWRQTYQDTFFNQKSDLLSHRRLDRSNYLDDMLYRRCEDRALIHTHQGTIGLAAKGTKKGDIICVVLGCDRPLILRPLYDEDNQYTFIGEAYVHELRDARALLGPLPAPWRVQVFDHPDHEFWQIYKYFNPETGELTVEDPRLEPLEGWERVPLEERSSVRADDPETCDFFRNTETGEIVNSDPRLSVQALKARGVALETITII